MLIPTLFAMVPSLVCNATVAKLAEDLSDTTMRQRSSSPATGLSTLSWRDGDAIYLLGPRYPSLDGLSLVVTKFPSTPRKLAADLSLLLYRNWWTLHSHRKKNSQCWLMLAMDFIFGKVRDFVCQIKHLTTMGYDTDMLKSHDDFIPHAKHYAGKTFTTQLESLNCRLRHYLARLHRKTLCYSKSNTILEFSFKLLINKLNIT